MILSIYGLPDMVKTLTFTAVWAILADNTVIIKNGEVERLLFKF